MKCVSAHYQRVRCYIYYSLQSVIFLYNLRRSYHDSSLCLFTPRIISGWGPWSTRATDLSTLSNSGSLALGSAAATSAAAAASSAVGPAASAAVSGGGGSGSGERRHHVLDPLLLTLAAAYADDAPAASAAEDAVEAALALRAAAPFVALAGSFPPSSTSSSSSVMAAVASPQQVQQGGGMRQQLRNAWGSAKAVTAGTSSSSTTTTSAAAADSDGASPRPPTHDIFAAASSTTPYNSNKGSGVLVEEVGGEEGEWDSGDALLAAAEAGSIAGMLAACTGSDSLNEATFGSDANALLASRSALMQAASDVSGDGGGDSLMRVTEMWVKECDGAGRIPAFRYASAMNTVAFYGHADALQYLLGGEGGSTGLTQPGFPDRLDATAPSSFTCDPAVAHALRILCAATTACGTEPDGRTPLHYAALGGASATLAWLMRALVAATPATAAATSDSACFGGAGGDLGAGGVGDEGRGAALLLQLRTASAGATPLHFAAASGCPATVTALLQASAPSTHPSSSATSSDPTVGGGGAWSTLLCDADAAHGWSALHYGALSSTSASATAAPGALITFLVEQHGVPVAAVDAAQRSAVHLAAGANNVAGLIALARLLQGADGGGGASRVTHGGGGGGGAAASSSASVDGGIGASASSWLTARDAHGNTPLHTAAAADACAAAAFLLTSAAAAVDVTPPEDVEDDCGRTPLEAAIDCGHDRVVALLSSWRRRRGASRAADGGDDDVVLRSGGEGGNSVGVASSSSGGGDIIAGGYFSLPPGDLQIVAAPFGQHAGPHVTLSWLPGSARLAQLLQLPCPPPLDIGASDTFSGSGSTLSTSSSSAHVEDVRGEETWRTRLMSISPSPSPPTYAIQWVRDPQRGGRGKDGASTSTSASALFLTLPPSVSVGSGDVNAPFQHQQGALSTRSGGGFNSGAIAVGAVGVRSLSEGSRLACDVTLLTLFSTALGGDGAPTKQHLFDTSSSAHSSVSALQARVISSGSGGSSGGSSSSSASWGGDRNRGGSAGAGGASNIVECTRGRSGVFFRVVVGPVA